MAQAGNINNDQVLARELEERKLALQRKIALHKTKLSQERASPAQTKERKLAAKKKVQILTGKRKLEAVSDIDSDSSEGGSSSDDSASDKSEAVVDSKMANALEVPTVGTTERSKKWLKKSSKRINEPECSMDKASYIAC